MRAVLDPVVQAPAAAFSLDDRIRSVRRFVMNALGSPPWRVRTERQPVADEQRPIGVVEASTPMVTVRSRTSIPQGDVERQQTFGIALYPAMAATAAESRLIASQVAELLSGAIGFGLVGDGVDTPPEMIPLYSFDGVPVKGVAREGGAVPYAWMRAEDFPVRPIQDPEDPLRWTVVCDLRVSWEQGGRVRPSAPAAGDVAGVFIAP